MTSDAKRVRDRKAAAQVPFKGNKKRMRYDLRIIAAVGEGRKLCRELTERGDANFIALFEFMGPRGAQPSKENVVMYVEKAGSRGVSTEVPDAVEKYRDGAAFLTSGP